MTEQLSFTEQHASAQGNGGAEARAPHLGDDPSVLPTLSDNSFFSSDPSSEMVHCTREQLFEELLRLRDDERERIGHELHDSAGQLLLYLQLSVARLRTIEAVAKHDDLLEEIQATTRQIASEIRSLAFINHPMQTPSEGLSAALRALVEGFGKRTGFRVSYRTRGDVSRFDDATSLALLRVAQEALVNIHRHAHASCVTMKLEARDGGLELVIRDNGVGMPSRNDATAHGGVGVDGMRFRVEQLGGELLIGNSKPGTKILAKLPLRRAG